MYVFSVHRQESMFGSLVKAGKSYAVLQGKIKYVRCAWVLFRPDYSPNPSLSTGRGLFFTLVSMTTCPSYANVFLR